MSLLVVRDITHTFGDFPVLDNVRLRVNTGDRVCLFGRNGEGKSTILRIIQGQMKPDHGAIDLQRNAVVGALSQEVPAAIDGSVFETVIGGLGKSRDRLRQYYRSVAKVSSDPTEKNLSSLSRAQNEIEIHSGWDLQNRVETTLSKLSLNGDDSFATLSGGWRRRVFLARALVAQPDILLLDEPTNHLDVEAIEWLEGMLKRYKGALIFVTHDRAFLREVATRIIDLDRGQLAEYPADFDAYLAAKAHALEVEATQQSVFDKKLAQEEVWVRTGIKARRTRNEGRVRALQQLRIQRQQRRVRKGKAAIKVQSSTRGGSLILDAKNLSFSYGTNEIVRDFSFTLKEGSRVGLIGPNGVGKTTLLRLLLGDTLTPDSGELRFGSRLKIRYYDQLRNDLKPTRTVAETIVAKGDTVEINGKRKHIVGYLRDFLFDKDQMNAPVSVLSGGERNRLLLAKLFSKPANVLVLDEPTNDLDMETLEVLETQILQFSGTVLLVSHDRAFLNQVVTESLIFEGNGVITRLVGGYEEWEKLRNKRKQKVEEEKQRILAEKQAAKKLTQETKSVPKLRFSERKELENLPTQIELLDQELSAIHELLSKPSVLRDPVLLRQHTSEMNALETKIEQAYERWEVLEELVQ